MFDVILVNVANSNCVWIMADKVIKVKINFQVFDKPFGKKHCIE